MRAMPKEEKKNLPASVHQRLLNLARNADRPLNELLQYYAIERFLYRLGQTRFRKKFVLKGAQMLRVWHTPTSRPTMDVDLLGTVENSVENLEKIVRECCAVEADDGVIFRPETVIGGVIRKNAEYRGVRVSLQGLLGNLRLNVQIDFFFGDTIVPSPVEISLPQILDFGSPALLGYTPESAIAEKFQAMVELDLTNTRIKDFYDIWLLSQNLKFQGEVLSEAIKTTFENRQTSLPIGLPSALTANFAGDDVKVNQWKAFLRKNRLDVEIELTEIVQLIAEFLMPVVDSLIENRDFPFSWESKIKWH